MCLGVLITSCELNPIKTGVSLWVFLSVSRLQFSFYNTILDPDALFLARFFFLLFNKILKGRVCLESEIPFYNTILDLDALRFQFLPFLTDINVAIRWCLVRRNPMVWPLEFEIKKKKLFVELERMLFLGKGVSFYFSIMEWNEKLEYKPFLSM